MKTRIAMVMVALCGLAAVGCSNQKTDGAAAAAKPVNAVCPISGGGIEGSTVHVAYKGQDVGLCCAGCTGKWAALSDAEKDAKLASSMKAK